MTVTIYQFNGSPPARAVLMTVEVLGLDVQLVEVNTLKGDQHDPKYLQKNPTHSQPLLEDDDFILPDSHSIIVYLASKYGGEKHTNLCPDDLKIRSTINHRLFFDATHLFPKARAIGISVFRDKCPGPSAEQIEQVKECYGFLEKYLQTSKFLVSDDITLADISCVASVSSLNTLVPIGEEFLMLKVWLRRLEEDNWYKKGNAPGLEFYGNLFKTQIEKNCKECQ